jgi:hypothetical protein
VPYEAIQFIYFETCEKDDLISLEHKWISQFMNEHRKLPILNGMHVPRGSVI